MICHTSHVPYFSSQACDSALFYCALLPSDDRVTFLHGDLCSGKSQLSLWITAMKDNLSADKLCFYVKTNVLASMKQVSYETVVTLSVNNCFVLAASCQCKASPLGSFSHVRSAVNDSLQKVADATACTSKVGSSAVRAPLAATAAKMHRNIKIAGISSV